MEILDLEIGSPVFIMSKSDGIIYPGIVYNQTIDKSIKNETVIWKIMVGPKNKRKVITTDNLEGFSIYKNIYELKEELFKQIMSSVETSVKDATANLRTWYEEEIPLPILAKALQNTPPKGSSAGFKEAKNMTFAELAGKEAVSALYEQATMEVTKKKRAGRPAKQNKVDETLPPIEEEQEVVQHTEQQEQEQPQQAPTDTKIRVKVKGPNGDYIFVNADDIDSIHDINF